MGMFGKLTIVQFINVSLVVLMVNFDFVEHDLWGFIPIFNGLYPDFVVQWYYQVGKTLCVTLIIYIVSPHGSYIAFALLGLIMRCYDRSCSCPGTLKKENDQVNTRKLL
jgi:hypothetical protein